MSRQPFHLWPEPKMWPTIEELDRLGVWFPKKIPGSIFTKAELDKAESEIQRLLWMAGNATWLGIDLAKPGTDQTRYFYLTDRPQITRGMIQELEISAAANAFNSGRLKAHSDFGCWDSHAADAFRYAMMATEPTAGLHLTRWKRYVAWLNRLVWR